MPDLSITAANVAPSTNCVTQNGTYGETVTAGQPVYKKASDNKVYRAQCDGTAEEASMVGVALNSGSNNQPATYAIGGDVSIGATVAVGQVYVVSATAGGIAPYADITTGQYVSAFAIGKTTSVITIKINNSGVLKA